MRYIGGKSRLLGFIKDVIEEKVHDADTACDIFAGTAAVALLLKQMDFTVVSNDIMEYSYAFQVAAIETCEYPLFEKLYDSGIVSQARAELAMLTAWSPLETSVPQEAAKLAGVVNYLNIPKHVSRGFFWNHFSKEKAEIPKHLPPEDVLPEEERMFFTSKNAEKIDGIRTLLHQWRKEELVTRREFYILLASLIDAADASANTTGVYGAYLKEFGGAPSAFLELRLPRINVQSPARPHRCYRMDAANCARREKFDLLYLDPPYNRRDYSANYHVPELIARGWFDAEPTLSGKTGLVGEFVELRSDFCRRDRCVGALEEVINAAIENSGVRYILMSYNSEGLIPDAEVERVLRGAGKPDTYERFTRDYKRYRSDSDSGSRSYKADRVKEYLYFVEIDR